MGAGTDATPHSLARHILSATARAEARQPLRVITVDKAAPIDLRRVTLAEAAEHLVVLEVSELGDLDGTNVVAIPGGQKNHRLFEHAETRRRSRMLG